MNLETLCHAIQMPQEVTAQLLALDAGEAPEISGLRSPELWEQAREELKQALGEDPLGLKELWCMLRAALAAWADYQALGLSREIYIATMGCFSRFVREHSQSYGVYGFDRGFWTVRQISCRLFRIGELEYELTQEEGQARISLHIPTDVCLALPGLRQSYTAARELLGRAFPAYRDAPYFCQSWLLSPQLGELLSPGSHILAFQRSFRLQAVPGQSQGVIQWVFKNPSLPPDRWPEDTSLQRKLKAFLLGGGVFQEGRGFLRDDPFLG